MTSYGFKVLLSIPNSASMEILLSLRLMVHYYAFKRILRIPEMTSYGFKVFELCSKLTL